MNVLTEVDALYDSLDDPAHLEIFLRHIQNEFKANNVGVAWVNQLTGERAHIGTDANRDLQLAYLEHIDQDPWMLAAMTWDYLPPVILGSELVPPKDYRNTWFYADIMGPTDIDHALSIAKINENSSIIMPINRSVHQGDFNDSDKQSIQPLIRHIFRFGEMLQDRSELRQIKQLNLPQFQISANETIQMNPQAEALLTSQSAQSALSVRNNQLTLTHAKANQVLQRFLHNIEHRHWDLTSSEAIRFPCGTVEGHLLVFPQTLVQTDFTRRYGATVVAVVPNLDLVNTAIKKFELTPAQAALARGIVSGMTLNEFAQSQKKSVHTVRTQLRQVFAKTGCTSQAALIRLLSSPLA